MKIVLFANTDWYIYNFRRSLALALKEQGYDPLLISPPGPYGPKLRELGLRWEPVPMDRRSLNPLREARLLAWLVALFRRERPALVHGFTIKCAVYGSLAARIGRVPARVNAVAGMGYVFTSDDAKARLLRPLVRALLRLALGGVGARLILQNPDDVAEFLRARLVDARSIHLIPSSGVDSTRFNTCGDDRPGAYQPLRVVLAARLLRHKGLFEFVEASRLLQQRGRNVVFLLAGTPDEGNPDSVPAATVRGWVDMGLVKWLGHVDDMAPLLRGCNVMALPSYYGEGLPRSLIEASASGLALITTDMPGCRQAIDDGLTGLTVPPRDAEALAAAIELLDEDRALTERLGIAGRAKALAEFDERIVIADTVAVYRELDAPVPSTQSSDPPPSMLAPLGRLLLALSMAILLIAVLLPSDTLSWLRSDYRMLGQLMNSIEQLMPRVDLTHVLLFGSIGFLCSSLWPRLPWSRVALSLLGLAVGTELAQFLVPGREPRIIDVGFDLLGGGLGMITAMLLQRRWWRAGREARVDSI